MSVLIKGVKMPRGCIACPFMFFGRDDYLMWCKWIGGPLGEWSKYRDKWRHPACPLVKVPTPQNRPVTWGDVSDSLKVLEALLETIEAEEGEDHDA